MKKKLFLILPIILVAAVLLMLGRNAKPKPRIAFVIDDWGYNLNNIDLVIQIDRPLTISILPNLRYSRKVAERILNDAKIHDVILHLPLESKSDMTSEVDTIRLNMSKEKIISTLIDDMESIPGIVGVSNHQGSKATGDRRVMVIVLNELKKRGLFFLDSLTTPDSICSDIAQDIGLRYTVRDVFLDLTDQTDLEHFESYIRKQVNELRDVALKEGKAVGIGHNKEIMLRVIKYSIPEFEKQDIEIVPLKELVE